MNVNLIMWLLVVTLFVCGFFCSFAVHPLYLLLAAYGLFLFLRGLVTIPADPETVGLLTIWGHKTNTVLSEGIYLIAPDFPLFVDAIPIELTKKNREFTITDVPCIDVHRTSESASNSGMVDVVVKVGITYIPDEQRLANYILSGKDQGIEKILAEKIGDEVRQMGREKTWQEMTRATDKMSYLIIQKLTDLTLNEKTELEIDKCMKNFALNGCADIQDLGIIIKRVNVSNIKVNESISRSAKLRAEEEQQRRGGYYEMVTELTLAKQMYAVYQELGEKRNFEDCLLEVRQRKALREGHGQIYEVPGLARIASAIEKAVGG